MTTLIPSVGHCCSHKIGQHCSSQIWQRRTQWAVRWENPHVIHDDVALCRRQTWQRCILSGIQCTHTPSIYMHAYVLDRHVLRGTGCWDRGLSCEKAMRNVPVLRVHIIAFWWYFLGNEVLCFFHSRVSHHRPCLNTVIWLHYIALLSSCAMYYCILLGLCRSCAPRFLLCISLYVTCSMSCTFCVYVICAPSHLALRIPFLYTVVRHTLSV